MISIRKVLKFMNSPRKLVVLVGEKLSIEHKKEKELNREVFWIIFQNICCLAHQGLALY